MKPVLVFATRNQHKIHEVNSLLQGSFEIKSLDDIGCFEELPETHPTIAENSFEKSEYVFRKYKCDCFAEDSGLEVFALNGEPGVNSAHYSGKRDSTANINLLLERLKNKTDRSARFVTVFTLFIHEKSYQFEGSVTGKIVEIPLGKNGFGYDPIFIPDGSGLTFAQMTTAQKSMFSHRGKAFFLFERFLNDNF